MIQFQVCKATGRVVAAPKPDRLAARRFTHFSLEHIYPSWMGCFVNHICFPGAARLQSLWSELFAI